MKNIKETENKTEDLQEKTDVTAAKIAELEGQIKQAVELTDKAEDDRLATENQLKKVLADYANLQRDMDKRNGIAISQLKAKASLEIINVIDDVNFALQAKENLEVTEQVKAWLDGLVATLNNLRKALDVLGVRAMGCKKGDKYDSGLHQALSVVPVGEPDTLVEVVQDGYVLGEMDVMIVRPARVIVAQKKL